MKCGWLISFGLLIGTANAATVAITQGTGTNFLTKTDVSGNNASSITVCDATAPGTCAPVSATTGLKIDLSAAFGTAGTANTNVLSVQGIASGTALLVTGTGGTFPISGATSNASSGVATSSTNVPTIGYNYGFNGTTWDQLQVDASKNLRTTTVGTGTAGSAATGVLTVQGIASMTKLLVTPDSVALPANQSVNVSQVNGVTTLTGAGATGTGAQRVTAAQDTTTIAGSAPGTAGSASTNVVTVQGIASGTTLPVSQSSQYPIGAVAETASATGTTAATTATLATNTGQTTSICGFSIRANATAAATNNATVTGTITGTLNFTQWTAPLASGLGVTEMVFNPCIPASTTNTSIAVVSGAPGSGGVVSVTAWGFLK